MVPSDLRDDVRFSALVLGALVVLFVAATLLGWREVAAAAVATIVLCFILCATLVGRDLFAWRRTRREIDEAVERWRRNGSL